MPDARASKFAKRDKASEEEEEEETAAKVRSAPRQWANSNADLLVTCDLQPVSCDEHTSRDLQTALQTALTCGDRRVYDV